MKDDIKLAEDLSSKINLEFRNQFLVKPLEKMMVTKEFDVPVIKKEDEQIHKDQNGVDAIDIETTKEIKEVPSDYQKGIVLKLPTAYTNSERKEIDIKVGYTIYFRCGRYFDVLKDTMLVDMFNIVAVEA